MNASPTFTKSDKPTVAPKHPLDLLYHPRTKFAWIAVAHGVLIVAGLGVVWWATRSAGTPAVHAGGWPTSAEHWPESTGTSNTKPAPRTTESVRPSIARTHAPSSEPERPSEASHQPAPQPTVGQPEIIPGLVEFPLGNGLIESVQDSDAALANQPLAVEYTQPIDATPTFTPLPPGGVRPTLERPAPPVAWKPATNAAASTADAGVALTTGQIQTLPADLPTTTQNQAPTQTPAQSTALQTQTEKPAAVTPAAPDPDVSNAPASTPERLQAAAPAAPTDRLTGSFFGLPTGNRTVYLIDASGSLIDTLPFAIEELYRAVRTLDQSQSYAVVFFNGQGVLEAAPGGMQPASRRNLSQTLTWLEPRLNHVRATGRPDASDALAHALILNPDTILLLSDGVTGLRDPAGDRRKLVTLLERLGQGVRIHTVQFIDPDPLATRGRLGTLELLASLTGGRHRFVGLQDVQPKPRPKARP